MDGLICRMLVLVLVLVPEAINSLLVLPEVSSYFSEVIISFGNCAEYSLRMVSVLRIENCGEDV